MPPPAVRERRTRLAGFETRILSSPGSGPPVVFIHGFADSADCWRPAIDGLARAGRATCAIDLPGFGTADPMRRGPILPQIDAVLDDLIEDRARRSGGAGVILCGNSLGGCAVMRAAERGGPITALVPVAPAGLDLARWIGVIESERLLGPLVTSPIPVPRPLVREVVGRAYRALAFSEQHRVDQESIASFASHLADVPTLRRVLETGRRLVPELKNPFRLHRITAPLLMVWGVRDRLVFPSGAQRVLDALPHARLELIENCGHCPQVERPARLVELLLGEPGPAAIPRLEESDEPQERQPKRLRRRR